MKLSAVVLLTVNFVAASQVAAHASDTASFLQEALAPQANSVKQGGQAAASPRAARPARKSSSYVSMTPVTDGAKMRPFVPGRYLPSESDLQAKKQSEIAAQAPFQSPSLSTGGVLTGQVSTNAAAMNELGAIAAPAASYAMSKPVNQDYIHNIAQIAIQKVKAAAKSYTAAHPRAVPGVNPVVPGQVARLPGNAGVMPEIPEPPGPKASSLQIPQPQARPSSPVQVPAPPVVSAPELSKYETSQLERLVDSNSPENVYAGQKAASGVLPMNQGTRGRAINPAVSQARFGSWHGGNGLSTASFHSYVPIHMTGPMSVKITQHSTSHRTGSQSATMASHPAHASQVRKPVAEKQKADSVSYPPYRRYNLYM
jgi:hypothetical protein